MYETLELAYAPGIATLTLNRPEKRNALSYALIHELLNALGEAAASEAKVLIVTGAGRAFCSGMDLEDLRALAGRSAEQSLAESRTMARLFRSVYEFPAPTIAAVNGAAVAGGCGLATLCDFAVAVPEAKFGYTEARIGFLPALVSAFLVRQIGERAARDLLLTGRMIAAEEALRLGLINEVVPPERLMARAGGMAASLLENSPASLRATKQLLNGYARARLDRDIAAAEIENARIRGTPDFLEGVSSFLEKRKPKWQ
jgi:methylglutaconyl-CoA hydratase